MNVLRRADFWVLDHVFTTAAYWLRDAFDWRTKSLGLACLTGCVVGVGVAPNIYGKCLLGVGTVGILIGEYFDQRPSGREGFDNIRRHTDSWYRLFGALLLITPPYKTDFIVWQASLLCAMYFFAVRERPRKPKTFSLGEPITNSPAA